MKPEELKKLRKELDLTQYRLGLLLHVCEKTIGRYEKGTHDMPILRSEAARNLLLKGKINESAREV